MKSRNYEAPSYMFFSCLLMLLSNCTALNPEDNTVQKLLIDRVQIFKGKLVLKRKWAIP
jgi:hypothetical protein